MISESTSSAPAWGDLSFELVSRLWDDPQLAHSKLNRAQWNTYLTNNIGVPLPDIDWDDVLDDVQNYRQQIEFYEAHSLPVIAAELGEGRIVPVSLNVDVLNGLMATGRLPFSAPLSLADSLEVQADIRLSPETKLIECSTADALHLFQYGVVDSIRARLAAWSAGSSSGSTYNFEVSTKSSGLRVYWTPAAILRTGNVLGYPSTPVNGMLRPGKYCFGAGSPGAAATYEMTAYYDVPAQSKAYLNV